MEQSVSGTSDYNGSPYSFEEFVGNLKLDQGDLEAFEQTKEAVYLTNNAYWNSATMSDREEGSLDSRFDPKVRIVQEGARIYLEIKVNQKLLDRRAEILTSDDLGSVRIVEMCYENPDGSPVVLDMDYLGWEPREMFARILVRYPDLKEEKYNPCLGKLEISQT